MTQSRSGRRSRAQQAADAAEHGPPVDPGDGPPTPEEFGLDATGRLPETVVPGTEDGPPAEDPPTDPEDPPGDDPEVGTGDGFPPGGAGRSSAQRDPQLQMDEVVLDPEEHLEMIRDWEIMERTHEAKLQYDKAQRANRKRLEDLALYDGQPHALRVGDFRVFQAPPKGDPKDISFTRNPIQKTTVTRIKD